MAEEFQGVVCGGNWWINSPRNLFGSSPCSSVFNGGVGSFGGWPHDGLLTNAKTTRSSDDSTGSASDSSVVIQDGNIMGINLSSSPASDHNWINNQDLLLDSARSHQNYSHLLPDSSALNSTMNYHQQTGLNNSVPIKSYCQDSSTVISSFKQDFSFEQQSITSDIGFPLNSASYGYNPASLLQTFLETDSQPHESLSDNQAMDYSSVANYWMVNSNEVSLPSLPKSSPMMNNSLPIQQPLGHLQIANNVPCWSTIAAAALANVRPNFLPSTQSQFPPSSVKSNIPNMTAKRHNQESRNIDSREKKANDKPALKRPRLETPSPLPTFKVRKEKLGDRITALQQLVSPFGKTDTASVLHEAIEYIKFLHDQVSVLSTPYLKNGSPPVQCQQLTRDKIKDQEGVMNQDLKSRGLCLVPISSTFPVAMETSSDFWTPSYGTCLR